MNHIEDGGPATGTARKPVRVILADDHAMFREGLARLLSSREGVEVVGQTTNDEGAVEELARERKPDVVVAEVQRPMDRARGFLERIALLVPPPKVVICTMLEDPDYVGELLGMGASAYVVKSASAERLVTAIRAAIFDPKGHNVVVGMLRATPEEAEGGSEGVLSARETEVLVLVSRGLSNRQVARALHLSEAALRADLVVSTGGLGPTPDDLTHEALGRATGRTLVEYPEARRHLDEAFWRFTGRRPPPSAHKQALFPQGSELIFNPLGTAMGAILQLEGTLFVTLPGVPKEMEGMFEEALGPLIGERSVGTIVSLVLRFAGISEEEMSEKIRDLLDASDPRVAPLVGPGEVGRGEVSLRVTTRAPTRAEAEDNIEPVAAEILSRLGAYSL